MHLLNISSTTETLHSRHSKENTLKRHCFPFSFLSQTWKCFLATYTGLNGASRNFSGNARLAFAKTTQRCCLWWMKQTLSKTGVQRNIFQGANICMGAHRSNFWFANTWQLNLRTSLATEICQRRSQTGASNQDNFGKVLRRHGVNQTRSANWKQTIVWYPRAHNHTRLTFVQRNHSIVGLDKAQCCLMQSLCHRTVLLSRLIFDNKGTFPRSISFSTKRWASCAAADFGDDPTAHKFLVETHPDISTTSLCCTGEKSFFYDCIAKEKKNKPSNDTNTFFLSGKTWKRISTSMSTEMLQACTEPIVLEQNPLSLLLNRSFLNRDTGILGQDCICQWNSESQWFLKPSNSPIKLSPERQSN